MAEDEKLIIESLSPIERNVLPVLSGDFVDIEEVAENGDIDKTTALRAVKFLENKKLVEVDEKVGKIVQAGVNGLFYLKKQLPERRLLNKLAEKKAILIHEIKNECGLNENEAKVAIGVLKRKALVSIVNGRVMFSGKKEEVTKKMLEELFLEKLPTEFDKLEDKDKLALENLKKRKEIIEVIDEKKISVKLTSLGEKISKSNLKVD